MVAENHVIRAISFMETRVAGGAERSARLSGYVRSRFGTGGPAESSRPPVPTRGSPYFSHSPPPSTLSFVNTRESRTISFGTCLPAKSRAARA